MKIIDGLEFFIPNNLSKKMTGISNNNNDYLTVVNYPRCDEVIHGENCIYINDLNKSDYLFELIVLLIVRKIEKYKTNKRKRNDEEFDGIKILFDLIDEARLIADSIAYYEISQFNEEILPSHDYISKDELENRNKRFIDECRKERVF